MQQFINLLAIAGGIMIILEAVGCVENVIQRRREEKRRRMRRIERFRNYPSRYSSIRIANEFAAELKEKPEPIRKATGYFSDTDAQEVVK